jgi:hypothetical protein
VRWRQAAASERLESRIARRGHPANDLTEGRVKMPASIKLLDGRSSRDRPVHSETALLAPTRAPGVVTQTRIFGRAASKGQVADQDRNQLSHLEDCAQKGPSDCRIPKGIATIRRRTACSRGLQVGQPALRTWRVKLARPVGIWRASLAGAAPS